LELSLAAHRFRRPSNLHTHANPDANLDTHTNPDAHTNPDTHAQAHAHAYAYAFTFTFTFVIDLATLGFPVQHAGQQGHLAKGHPASQREHRSQGGYG
jgi:hypothetical protein